MEIFEVKTNDGTQTVYGYEFEQGVYFAGVYNSFPVITDNRINFCPIGYSKKEAIDWEVNPDRGSLLIDDFLNGNFSYYPDGSEARIKNESETDIEGEAKKYFSIDIKEKRLRNELAKIGVYWHKLSANDQILLLNGKETANRHTIIKDKDGVFRYETGTIKASFDANNNVSVKLNVIGSFNQNKGRKL